MKLFCQYMTIFYNFHSLKVIENCDSNTRLVVNEDDNGKFRPERVNVRLCLSKNQNKCNRTKSYTGLPVA